MLSTMTKVLPVQFISSWNEGDVETPAKLNLETGEIFDIEKSDDGDNYQGLSGQFVEAVDGKVRAPVKVDLDDTYRIARVHDLLAIRSHYTYLG